MMDDQFDFFEFFFQALKKLRAVNTHFTDMIEDQFDFHTYCLRKMTLRAYIELLRCEDTIYLQAQSRFLIFIVIMCVCVCVCVCMCVCV